MNKFECISTFIAVIEENGFAAAGKKLSLSTAAISRQIANLEQDLGVQLLKRTTRRISLTDPGQAYYEQCKRIIDELNTAEDELKTSQQQAKGVLNILSNRYSADKYIIPKLKKFLKDHPHLQLKLQLGEYFPDFTKDDIDIVFGVSLEGPPLLTRRQVGMTRYVLCASADYLTKYGTPKSPNDLLKHRYITHMMRTPDNVISLADKEITLSPFMWLNDSRAMRECAIAGVGIVRLHDYVVEDAILSGDLIEILPEYHQERFPIFLYFQKSRYLQPKIRKFIDFFTS